ncbi:MAG TPA: RNA polymerase sigma factor [Thermoanaerobaculia bacterium]|jgi:RNA polymerase sigma-70 factor (ECF subfamily)
MGGNATDSAGEREAAFRELVEQHGRMVFRVAYRITGNEADAEDVAQEAFLKAYRSFDRFDSRASFSTWIFRIASNCAIDVIRRRKTRPEIPSDVEGPDFPVPASVAPSPHDALASAQVGSRLREALAELSPHERTAFVLRHFEGEPTEEIARCLGVGVNAAKQTVFRAVRKLRAALAPLRESLP